MTKVHNLPADYRNYEFIVIREYYGEMYFVGMYHTYRMAEITANLCGGKIC